MAQTTCSVSYTCLFGVWRLKIHFLGVSGPKKTNISSRFRTCPICWGNLFSIRALGNKLPLNVKITPKKLDFRWEVTNQEFLIIVAVQPEVYFSRWLPPPSWISRICCHFFNIISILTKFCGIVENLPWNSTVTLKCMFIKIQDGGRRHLEFRKSVAISSLLDQSSPNLVGMLRICKTPTQN